MGSAPAPEIKVKITGEDTGVSAAIKELSLQLQQLKRTQDEAGSSAKNLGAAEAGAGRSMREARESARLLSEETGVHLSRGLTGVLAKSTTLGPILNAAFPAAAAIGFIAVIASGTEKLTELIVNTFIYTEAMQAEYAAQVLANKEIEKANEKIAELKKAYDLIGLSGSDLGRAKLEQLRKEIDDATAAFEKLKKKPAEIAEVPMWKSILGQGLRGLGVDTGVDLPDVDTAQAGKDRQVNVGSKNLDVQKQEQLNQQKELGVTMAAEAKTAAEKAKTERDAANKAKLAQLEAGFANELSLYKAQHSKLDQDNEASYVKGLGSLATYYDRKKQLAAEASQKEIDTLTAERSRVLSAPTKDDAEKIANQTKAAEIANKIAIAKVNAERTAQQLANEGAQKQEELDRKVLDFQAQIARAQGQRFDEASARIAAEALEMAQKLREAGIAPDQVDAMVAKFKAAATQQAQFAGKKTTGQDAISALSEDEADIRLKNIAVVADAKIAELERARIPVLQAIAAAMTKAAVGQDQIKAAADFTKEIDKLAESAKKASVDFTSFEDSATTAIKGDLTTFLGSTITQAKSVGDAFRQLAQSVVGSIQKIIAQLLIQIVTQKLVQAITGQGQNQGGASADKMVTASLAMSIGGTEVKKGADDLQNAADSLMASATMLLIANSAGGGGGGAIGGATGGLVTGPGSGTSDSIPARLSAGEFVMRAASVRDIGVERLAMMNRGLNIGSITGMSIPRFAEGGLVTHGSGSSGVDLHMKLGLEEGLVLKHLSSKSAGRVILQHIGNNPRAVSRAISRGDNQS